MRDAGAGATLLGLAGSAALRRAVAELPVASTLPELARVLAQGNAVLAAPPGSGKTTLVPLALMQRLGRSPAPRIVLVTPRQVAARAAARRMSQLLGTALGGTVGYHVRWDRRSSGDTRVTVMTEGMLLRRLEADPELPGVGLVILDEFHERSLDADLLLALLLEVQASLREDLRLLVMSATLDADAVAALLERGGRPAAVLRAEGRQFPVHVRHHSLPASPLTDPNAFADGVARAVIDALTGGQGDALVFLPGMREQRAVAERLHGRIDAEVHLLHGSLDSRAQDAALAPAAGRKVILSTPIAQTSLTVEGVDIVVDSGWHRTAAFDAAAGSNRLLTRRISRAAAEQRAGRAGRLRPGSCLRLWSRDQHAALDLADSAEILRADLAPFLLRAAAWGHPHGDDLPLLDAPPPAALARARSLLVDLEAVDARGAVTARGRAMLAMPLPPRLAAMLLRARDDGHAEAALWLAALLEADSGSGLDVEARFAAMAERPDETSQRLVADLAGSLGLRVGRRPPPVDEATLGRILCRAYPERVARRRPEGDGRFLCADGGEVQLPAPGSLAHAEWIVVAHWTPGSRRRARLAARLDAAAVQAGDCVPLSWREHLAWDDARQAVIAERRQQLGALILDRQPLTEADPTRLSALLCEAVARAGLAVLPWSDAARSLQARAASLRVWNGDPWPRIDDTALAERIDEWLLPWLSGMSRFSHLRALDMLAVMRSLLGPQGRELDALAPTHITVPAGQQVALRYSADGAPPVLAVKLQALFGLAEGPAVNGGRMPVQIHLLSPAGRPLQVTQDLASFWRRGYPEVARDLRGRYPKHPWPDDPLAATPSMGTRRRRA